MSHTPTPWEIYEARDLNDYNQLFNRRTDELIGSIIDDDNAEIIVRAVNSHYGLLEAGKSLLFFTKKLCKALGCNLEETAFGSIEHMEKEIIKAEGK